MKWIVGWHHVDIPPNGPQIPTTESDKNLTTATVQISIHKSPSANNMPVIARSDVRVSRLYLGPSTAGCRHKIQTTTQDRMVGTYLHGHWTRDRPPGIPYQTAANIEQGSTLITTYLLQVDTLQPSLAQQRNMLCSTQRLSQTHAPEAHIQMISSTQ